MFSLLIANYNNGRFFEDCYQSILAQTYSNWEVVIVDDHSSDDSVEIIRKLIENDGRFRFYSNDENKGCGFSKNKCAALAKGEILGFLDPDDALLEDALEGMVKLHKEYPEVAIITSKYMLVDKDLNYQGISTHGEAIPEGKSYLTHARGAMTHFATFKKVCYDNTIGINKSMKRAVDQDLYFKLEEQGGSLFLNKVLYKYRIHKNGISQHYNTFKAEYWHHRALIDAYRRRKNSSDLDNYSMEEIKTLRCDYLLQRFQRARQLGKLRSQIYFLVKAFQVYPSYKLRFKAKSALRLIGVKNG